MNRIVTSKEQILAAARELVAEEGLQGLSIRRVAAKCSVSVGALYNYFPTKAQLVMAVAEDFWKTAFHSGVRDVSRNLPFPAFFGAVYQNFQNHLGTFRKDFLQQLDALSGREITEGRLLEEHSLEHLREELYQALDRDQSVPREIWTEQFPKRELADFAFTNLMALLREGRPDCAFFQQVLQKLLTP